MTGSVLGPLLSGLLGLIGVVGALVTAWMQNRNARLARVAAEHAAAREAVRELLATSEITYGLYETVRILDKGGRSQRPEKHFERAVEAWVTYMNAREKVRVLAPEEFRAPVDELTAALTAETDPVEAVYQRAKNVQPMDDTQATEVWADIWSAQKTIRGDLDRLLPPATRAPGVR